MMPTVKFGKKDEPATEFRKSDDLIVVRTRSEQSLFAGPVPSGAAAELADGQKVAEFPDVGVEVYQVPIEGRARGVEVRKEALRLNADVRFAGGALVDDQSGEPVVYTENLFVKFRDDADREQCLAVIREYGLTVKRELDYATNAFFLAAPEGSGLQVFELANTLLERDDVEYSHPEIVRERRFRAIDPRQWHLATTTINGVEIKASANVAAAHAVTQGEGVTIAIVDDGVDLEHIEFSAAGKIVSPRDVTRATDNPRPRSGDRHGTACAGVACAGGLVGASGVAPRARLMPIRLVSGLGSLAEGDAFKWAADKGAEIISCSWGPPDGDWFDPDDPAHQMMVPLPASTKLAMDYAVERGRGGKGCVILFAAGNGNESVENDGYASYEKVIAVAACNDRGKRSVYSDFGDAVLCAFPSNDFEFPPTNQPRPLTPGIWTTDRSGVSGYNPGNLNAGDEAGNYTNSFGGTSSACPGAAGVAALILAVNPELRWQEVRELLRRSCDRIDPQGGNYNDNGHSPLYGAGRLNAATAVQLARPTPRNRVSISRSFNQPLPDLQAVEAELDVAHTDLLESLSVQVDIRHTFIGDLIVTLIPPAGVDGGPIPLHNRSGGSRRDLKLNLDAVALPALARFQGKAARGTWTLRVEDVATRDVGVLTSFGVELTFAGAAPLRSSNGRLPEPPPRRKRSGG